MGFWTILFCESGPSHSPIRDDIKRPDAAAPAASPFPCGNRSNNPGGCPMFRSCLRGAAFAAPAAFLLALLATPSSAIQRNVTIYQIQDTTSVGHVIEGSTDTVTTTGIITGADTRPTGFGYYIQDAAGGNYSGVQVFTGGANAFA